MTKDIDQETEEIIAIEKELNMTTAQIKKSKTRRLDAEIERIEYDIDFTKQMIKHDPYKEDLPGLRKGLVDLQNDLKQAKNDRKQLGK